MNRACDAVEVRRAGALVAVLMLLVIGVIIAASVLVTADAASATSEAELHRTQSRAIAWSGVQAVMAELAEQREDLLDGLPPDITPEWDLYTLDDGTRGVVRLIDLAPDDHSLISPEGAKLDINTATAEMLALIPGLDQVTADRIVAARDGAPFTSVEQLLGIDGISPELLYGSVAGGRTVPVFEIESLSAPLGGAGAIDGGRGLLPFLTVFSFDPNVQVGFGGEADHRGNLRINLDQSWSDSLDDAITDRFDSDTASFVKAIMESGQAFASDSELIRFLVESKMEPEEWAEVLDVFTTSDDQFLRGRVDINTASPEVLACVPAISPDVADEIVDYRGSLDADARRTPTWLVVEGLLTPEEYVSAADWVTTRSMQWRVRLEVGVEVGDPLGGFDESAAMTLDQLIDSWDEPDAGAALRHRVVLEVVVDLGSTRPRVAYLREVTLLEPALAMHRATSESEDDNAPPGPSEAQSELDALAESFETDLAEGDSFLGGDDGLGFGFGEPFEEMTPADSDPGEAGAGEPQPDETRDPPDMIDRRIGRWSTRKAGDS